jgi:hypothetical protein
MQIGLSDMPLFNANLLFLDHHRRLAMLTPRESKVVRRVQPHRLAGLEDVWHSIQENINSVRSQAVAYVLNFLVRKPFRNMILGIGVLGDVNRLFLLLKGPYDFLEIGLAIG